MGFIPRCSVGGCEVNATMMASCGQGPVGLYYYGRLGRTVWFPLQHRGVWK